MKNKIKWENSLLSYRRCTKNSYIHLKQGDVIFWGVEVTVYKILKIFTRKRSVYYCKLQHIGLDQIVKGNKPFYWKVVSDGNVRVIPKLKWELIKDEEK